MKDFNLNGFVFSFLKDFLPNAASQAANSLIISLEEKKDTLNSDEKQFLENLKKDKEKLLAENAQLKKSAKYGHFLLFVLFFGSGLIGGGFGYFIIPKPQPPRAVQIQFGEKKLILTEGNEATLDGIEVKVSKP